MHDKLPPQPHHDTLAQPKVDTREVLNLPASFETEKGSVYRYTPEGKSDRWKYDGTYHDPTGITVFLDDTPESLEVLTRLGTHQSHLPPEMQSKAYVAELDENRNGRKIFDIADVQDPESLYFVMVRPTDGQIIHGTHVSVRPQIGKYVFEINKNSEGRTVRHPGHRVSKISPR